MIRSHTRRLALLLLLVALTLPGPWAIKEAEAAYAVIDLGTLGGSTTAPGHMTVATGLNHQRQVVGYSYTPDGHPNAFIWSPADGMRSLGTLGGTSSWASAINEHGVVVGSAHDAEGTKRAFLWAPDTGMIDLGVLGHVNSHATDLNDSGTVVGYSFDDPSHPDQQTAFVWTASAGMQALGFATSRSSRARGINDGGQIAGDHHVTTPGPFGGDGLIGFVVDDGGVVQTVGSLAGYHYTSVWDINEQGQVVGGSFTDDQPSEQHAFLWSAEAGITDLGTLGGMYGYAQALNNHGQVVGESQNAEGHYRAFLWQQDTGMQYLCTVVDCAAAGWHGFAVAADINDHGDIVGFGATLAGERRAYLLQAVPLPASLWLLGPALLALAWSGRRSARAD